MVKIVFHGDPRTKKNSQRIVKFGARTAVIPSKKYKEYLDVCMIERCTHGLIRANRAIEEMLDAGNALNVKCVYYMATRRKVDLTNLMEATDDILVALGYLPDDNRDIVAGHDGSRVYYDKENPRVEIEITPMEEPYEKWGEMKKGRTK